MFFRKKQPQQNNFYQEEKPAPPPPIDLRPEFNWYNPDIKLVSIERKESTRRTIISFYFKDAQTSNDGMEIREWYFETDNVNHNRLCDEFNTALKKQNMVE